MAVYSSSRYPSTLPESLRLRPGGLTAQQFRLYEDFTILPRLVAAGEPGTSQGGQQQGPGQFNQQSSSQEPQQTLQAVEKFTVCHVSGNVSYTP